MTEIKEKRKIKIDDVFYFEKFKGKEQVERIQLFIQEGQKYKPIIFIVGKTSLPGIAVMLLETVSDKETEIPSHSFICRIRTKTGTFLRVYPESKFQDNFEIINNKEEKQ